MKIVDFRGTTAFVEELRNTEVMLNNRIEEELAMEEQARKEKQINKIKDLKKPKILVKVTFIALCNKSYISESSKSFKENSFTFSRMDILTIREPFI